MNSSQRFVIAHSGYTRETFILIVCVHLSAVGRDATAADRSARIDQQFFKHCHREYLGKQRRIHTSSGHEDPSTPSWVWATLNVA